MAASARAHPLGPEWATQRFRQLGWRLMPLRGFLAATFLYASLQKLANPDYLRAGSPTSAVAQMRALEGSSPIGPILRLSLHAPTLVGLGIAIGELAVATGILFGLWTRLAAVGGMLLSLTFFLTVSWATTPYYYGSDIVFVFAWSVFAMCGSGGVLSLDAWIAQRVSGQTSPADRSVDQVRRQVLVGARSAALLAGVAAVLGSATALIGRAAGGTDSSASTTFPLPRRSRPPQPSGSTTPRSPATPAGSATPGQPAGSGAGPSAGGSAEGVLLGAASAVPIGSGRSFTDPASGQPAWLLRPSASTVRAFTAVCTHAGCTVSFDGPANEFVCPCHGGRYSAVDGAVLGGPPPAPLSRIPAHIVNNEIRVD
jgi:thiosulfate dehydrogenase [quinone] large subunit